MMKTSEKKGSKAFSIIGAILCVILAFILVCNIAIIAKGLLSPAKPPSIFGTTPMVVLSGSMSGDAVDHIEAGDLIFAKEVDTKTLKTGDIISYMEESSTSVTTHRIIDIEKNEKGDLFFITKGDANNAIDESMVAEERVIGIYSGRIAKLGDFAMFLQEPLGMFCFIGIPLLGIIFFDIFRRKRTRSQESIRNDKLEEEVENLKKQLSEMKNKEN